MASRPPAAGSSTERSSSARRWPWCRGRSGTGWSPPPPKSKTAAARWVKGLPPCRPPWDTASPSAHALDGGVQREIAFAIKYGGIELARMRPLEGVAVNPGFESLLGFPAGENLILVVRLLRLAAHEHARARAQDVQAQKAGLVLDGPLALPEHPLEVLFAAAPDRYVVDGDEHVSGMRRPSGARARLSARRGRRCEETRGRA